MSAIVCHFAICLFFKVWLQISLNLLFSSQTQFSVAPPQSILAPKCPPPTFWMLESPLSSVRNRVKVKTLFFLDQRNNLVPDDRVGSDATREAEVNNLSEADMLLAYATAAGKVEDLTILVLA